MAVFLEILKYILPSIITFLAAYLTLRGLFKNEDKRRRYEILFENSKITVPVRLQAYERLTLFLERINPESLILRSSQGNQTSMQLQKELLNQIRTEFEHNFSQQIYMSREAWEVVKNAKSNTMKIINLAAEKVPPPSPSVNLSKAIIERMMEEPKSPSQVGIDYLRKEIQEYFKF